MRRYLCDFPCKVDDKGIESEDKQICIVPDWIQFQILNSFVLPINIPAICSNAGYVENITKCHTKMARRCYLTIASPNQMGTELISLYMRSSTKQFGTIFHKILCDRATFVCCECLCALRAFNMKWSPLRWLCSIEPLTHCYHIWRSLFGCCWWFFVCRCCFCCCPCLLTSSQLESSDFAQKLNNE